MKYLLSIFVLFNTISASSYSLQNIEEKLQKTHPLYLSIEEQKSANLAKIRGEYASNPYVLSGSGAKAKPSNNDEEFEYSVEVGKTFLLGDAKAKSLNIAKLNNEAISLELERELLAFSNHVKLLYHTSCLSKEQREFFEESYSDFEKLYTKKEKAYKYQEISKKELLSLKIEKAVLKQKLQSLKADEEISKFALLDLLELKNKGSNELFCHDLYPMEFSETNSPNIFLLSKRAYKAKILGARKSAKLYDRRFESIDISAGYDNEIDMERYGIGVSLPLSFTSKTNEYKKIAALHNQKVLKLQQQNMFLEKERKFKQLKSKLENEKNIIHLTEDNIHAYETELLPLVKKSYQFGKSSVVEYLLSKQKLWQLYETLNINKKIYYETLFELYTVAEIKEKK